MNIGHNHEINVPLNLADPRIGYEHQSAINQRVDNPFFGLPGEIVPGDLRNQRQVAVSQLIRPYPHYGDVTFLGDGVARQRYRAFQLKIQRPFTNGFNFLFGYNYNRGKTDDFYDAVDAFDRRLDYQRDPLSGQSLTFSTIYELPFGRGRKWGAGMHPVANAIFGGWSISGIYRYLDGQLLRFGGMQVLGDPTVSNPTRERWFNQDAFERLQPFTRRTNPWYFDDLRGPFFSNLDMTFNKKFDIGERVDLEFRMEAYNLTNTFMGDEPSTDVNSGNFGRITSQLNTHSGREWQYSMRFIW
ncbi:MAG TPA: hypothetical protein VLD18_13510 [Verrucomicrobiae bacterium]|nr:hypothetical protein [Verrucomicrobiae bacterium]